MYAMLNLCKINSLAVTNQIIHFCMTTVGSSVVYTKNVWPNS